MNTLQQYLTDLGSNLPSIIQPYITNALSPAPVEAKSPVAGEEKKAQGNKPIAQEKIKAMGYFFQGFLKQYVEGKPIEASICYQQAIIVGENPLAMFAYALNCQTSGVPTNREEAITYYDKAIQAGHQQAMRRRAFIYASEAKHLPDAIKLYCQAGEMKEALGLLLKIKHSQQPKNYLYFNNC